MLDSRGRDQLSAAAARVRAAAENLRWQEATSLWSSAWKLMTDLTEGVNIYNFLSPIQDGDSKLKPMWIVSLIFEQVYWLGVVHKLRYAVVAQWRHEFPAMR